YLAATRPSVMEATQSGNVLPATFSSTWETAIILELLAMEGAPLPSAGVIHLRSELISLRPMRVDDRFRCRVELDGIEPHARGWRLMLRGRNWNQAGQLCQENATEILVRGRQRNRPGGEGGSARQSSAATDEEGGGIGWQPRAEWRLPTNAGRRYARA